MILFGATVLFGPSAKALDCRPFEIYQKIELVKPKTAEKYRHLSSAQLVQKISKLPGHENFESLYRKHRDPSVLRCVYSYLSSDFDGDGTLDWKVATAEQLFDRPLPNDPDWDNDGLPNLFDPSPFQPGITPYQQNKNLIPPHLKLRAEEASPLNRVQKELFDRCGVLAVNHTDSHSLSTLNALLKVCERFFGKRMKKLGPLVVYAFAGHTVIDPSVASFFPQLNFMSLGGESVRSHLLSERNVISTLAHELGHYFLFNQIETEELVELARTYGRWNISKIDGKRSKFDPELMTPAPRGSSGFFPSEYSKVNVHEWFSEIFSIYAQRQIDPELDQFISLPEGLESWIKAKLSDE